MKPILMRYAQESSNPGIRAIFSHVTEPFPLHVHDFIEYEFVAEGSGRHFLNGVWQEIGPGDLWLLKENDCHAIEPQPTLVICCISCCPSGLPEYLRDFLEKQEYPMTGKLPTQEVLSRVRETFEELLAVSPNDPFRSEKKAALTQLLACQLLAYARRPILPNGQDDLLNYIHIVVRYIQEHYDEPVRLSDAAQTVGLTPCYLSTLFARYAGCGFTEYLTRVRIRKAIELISGTELSLLEIAERAGFGCGSSMNRAFRKYQKTVPGSFRILKNTETEQ